ncbi:uncharacterized protein LOC112514793 [Cynara cardunculus var. scolymus]|uniref:uncharacterized protein LOC112514793 n=1 Tax=Cynara cardunculus var. scolymus TaxID=59895 RepID=UPI000D62F33F|nr:uncharacterized protein LOC112514793 [Cynara cardunculus var. scolymus]
MKEKERINAYLARTITIVNEIKENGEVLTTNSFVAKILRSLTPKFNYVVCSVEESNDLDVMTTDELHGSLLVQEQRMLGRQEEEQVLKISNDKRGNQWSKGRRYYHGRFRGKGGSQGR